MTCLLLKRVLVILSHCNDIQLHIFTHIEPNIERNGCCHIPASRCAELAMKLYSLVYIDRQYFVVVFAWQHPVNMTKKYTITIILQLRLAMERLL